MLCQEDDEKRLRLVVCMSRKLNKHEVNYTVHEKELLALVESTTKWRHYLHGLPVIVYTDSYALKYLQTMAKPSPGRSSGCTDSKNSTSPFTTSRGRPTLWRIS